ncbi:MAPEG family protein [Chitiniphilus purpureus]|uniref:MAPEG family protein n=1 Tax=Chitiniphilus purpureus TaxID=2981137 RepID=A0ABY6DKU8_9NEIS|nr:MAPEG family protein [Chitiniphilus sp. CD1]UXY14853.1 MAPEG family protein [Chitiniphilus sp. CD1]
MSPTAFVVAAYIAWTLMLIIAIEAVRTLAVLRQGRAANTFLPDGTDISPFAHRLSRAHANCYESFPLVVGPLLLALAIDHPSLTDPLAPWLLAARIGQSCVHLASISLPAVQLRFALFAVQLGLVAWMLARLIPGGFAS